MSPIRNAFSVVTSALLITCSAIAGDVPAAMNRGGYDTEIGADETASSSTALSNISTRAPVGSGDNAGIAGFIITGTASKSVLLRGIGPSLTAFGVPGALANPTLDLRRPDGTRIRANDNWQDDPAQAAAIQATGLPPQNNLEAAIIETLDPGSYTVILRGMGMTTGAGLVEVYDVEPAADSKLANISTRGLVSTGDNVMIAGTTIAGAAPQKVIIRAIGPSLSLPGKLSDPTLELRDANGGLIEANDDWGDSPNKQAIIDSMIPPSDPRESAIVATLPANGSNYTAIVRGVEAGSPSVRRLQFGSGNTPEIQRVQFAHTPTGGTFRLNVVRPSSIVSGQPGDKAALLGSITIAWNATAADIKAAIMASFNFYKYDQNNHLTAGPAGFHFLFDSGGGFNIAGNEGFRREPVVSGSVSDFTIQFGTLTTGAVGTRNTWIIGIPLVQVDDSSIIYGGTGIAVVEVYALP